MPAIQAFCRPEAQGHPQQREEFEAKEPSYFYTFYLFFISNLYLFTFGDCVMLRSPG